jgi:hypothetical protein
VHLFSPKDLKAGILAGGDFAPPVVILESSPPLP